MSTIRENIMGPIGPFLGLAIALAIISIISGLSILATGTSAGLVSGITQINSFLVIIGIGVAVAVMLKAFAMMS